MEKYIWRARVSQQERKPGLDYFVPVNILEEHNVRALFAGMKKL